MPEIAKELARSTLQTAGLGLGERHGSDEGRRYACQLMKEGHVRALFLEALKDRQHDLDVTAKSSNEANFASVCSDALGATPEHGSELPLSVVAAFAIRQHVHVYLIDTWVKEEKGQLPQEFSRQMSSQTTKFAVHYRDCKAAQLFKMVVKGKYAGQKGGCLVLFGAAHFTGVNPGVGGWEEKQECLADLLNLDYVLFT